MQNFWKISITFEIQHTTIIRVYILFSIKTHRSFGCWKFSVRSLRLFANIVDWFWCSHNKSECRKTSNKIWVIVFYGVFTHDQRDTIKVWQNTWNIQYQKADQSFSSLAVDNCASSKEEQLLKCIITQMVQAFSKRVVYWLQFTPSKTMNSIISASHPGVFVYIYGVNS